MICDKTTCTGITSTLYKNPDCTGDIIAKVNFLPGICVGDSATSSQKLTCVSGQIQVDKYAASKDCSGTSTTLTYKSGTCALGFKFEGCESTTAPTTTKSSTTSTTTSSSVSNKTASSSSSTTTFTLFGVIIAVFITSLF